MDTITGYKIPLKELNWKGIIKKIGLAWIHVCGIGSMLGNAIVMLYAMTKFWMREVLFLYELSMPIIFLETLMCVVSIFYCISLLIILFRRVEIR